MSSVYDKKVDVSDLLHLKIELKFPTIGSLISNFGHKRTFPAATYHIATTDAQY